jgi:hypothetical protein
LNPPYFDNLTTERIEFEDGQLIKSSFIAKDEIKIDPEQDQSSKNISPPFPLKPAQLFNNHYSFTSEQTFIYFKHNYFRIC